MANDLNQCMFIGRCGNDPDVSTSANGLQIARWSLAINSRYKDEDQTEWVRFVAFGKLADVVQQYVRKGKQIFASGRFTTNKWEDNNGVTRYSTSIICDKIQLLGSPAGERGSSEQYGQPTQGGSSPSKTIEDIDDDIPF